MASKTEEPAPAAFRSAVSETGDSARAAGIHPRRIRGCIVVLVTSVPVVVYLFSFFGRYQYWAELLGNFRLQIFAMLAIGLFLAMLARCWRWAAVLSLITLFSLLDVAFIYWPAMQGAPGPEKIKVMSFNVLGTNSQHELVIQRIRQVDPDVIAIQEYSNHWHYSFEELKDEYPHSIREPRWHGFGLALFSKREIGDVQVYQLTAERTDNPAIFCQIDVGGRRLQIAAIHVLSPTNRYRLEIRNQQLKELSELVADSQQPTVVVGDFNCTPWSPFLKDFLSQSGLRDSRRGFGIQGSWPTTVWPMKIPIDHGFVSEEIHVHDRQMAQPAGSDHWPLVLEVSISDLP